MNQLMVKNESGWDWLSWLKENRMFAALFCIMAVYYLWRLFKIPPWYDELYTYQNFIDKGVKYSMTHWPLPNNHVLFSICSSVVNKMGVPYLGLRAVSLFASLGSLAVLYHILKKVMCLGMAVAGTAIFSSMFNVTQQAVQGRGYALSTFFLLLAVNLLYGICVPVNSDSGNLTQKVSVEQKRSGIKIFVYYAGFALCLTGGLYTVPSNLYWVISICFAGGIILLLNKNYRRLFNLIVSSITAAAATFALYSIIWFYNGSAELLNNNTGELFRMGRLEIISKTPLKVLSTGLKKMLSNKFIQSIERSQFMEGISDYMAELLNQFYPGIGNVFGCLVLFCLAAALARVIFAFRQGERAVFFLSVCCLVLTLMVPICISIQCVLPSVRVFTYMGSVLAMLFALTFSAGFFRWNMLPAAISVCVSVFCCCRPFYNKGYSKRDNDIYAALSQLDETQIESILVGEEYCQLELFFHIEKLRGKVLKIDRERPDYVLLDKVQADSWDKTLSWPYTMATNEVPWEWMNGHMEIVYENDSYMAWQAVRGENKE